MPERLEVGLASESDDEALRLLLRETAMPGNITLSFLREPSFFRAEEAGNISSQTMVYRGKSDRKLYGLGCRSIRRVFVDGQPTDVGYLSMLRGLPEARSGIGLVRGYNFLRKLHSDSRVKFYFTTILDDNTYAKAILTSGRAGLPTYRPLCQWRTYLLSLKRKRSSCPDEVEFLSQRNLRKTVTFINDWNSQRQLAPVYGVCDFLGKSNLLPEFDYKDVATYQMGGEILGTAAVWDQSGFKQTVVTEYSKALSLARPLYNLQAKLRGNPELPKPGECISFLATAMLTAKDDDATIYKALLNQLQNTWSGRGYDFLVVGAQVGSPLADILKPLAARTLDSTVYLVYWQEESILPNGLEGMVHVETATL